MILYKYVNLETAYAILDNHTLKFTDPYNLNDPFEISSLYYESSNRNYLAEENILNNIVVGNSYGILSLSRAPLNPLMWAHYGKGKKLPHEKGIRFNRFNDAHGGMVIGIDVDKAGLNCIYNNLIPAKFGSVIYTTIKPTDEFPNSNYHNLFQGLEHQYKHENYEALQRVFLYKSSHWSYEEEVRIVRNIGRRQEGKYGDKGIMEFGKECFVKVYIGSAHFHPSISAVTLYNRIIKAWPHCEVYICGTEGKTWDINASVMPFPPSN